MLIQNGATIFPSRTPDSLLPSCTDLVSQLGRRYLIKYVRKPDRYRYSVLSKVSHFSGVHYLTPTALCPDTIEAALRLPPFKIPQYALILDPSRLSACGPREIRGGKAVEYVLPNGYGVDAIVPPGWPQAIS
jgi:hypothetical protein